MTKRAIEAVEDTEVLCEGQVPLSKTAKCDDRVQFIVVPTDFADYDEEGNLTPESLKHARAWIFAVSEIFDHLPHNWPKDVCRDSLTKTRMEIKEGADDPDDITLLEKPCDYKFSHLMKVQIKTLLNPEDPDLEDLDPEYYYELTSDQRIQFWKNVPNQSPLKWLKLWEDWIHDRNTPCKYASDITNYDVANDFEHGEPERAQLFLYSLSKLLQTTDSTDVDLELESYVVEDYAL